MSRVKNNRWRSPALFIVPALFILGWIALVQQSDQQIAVKIEGANLQRILRYWKDAGTPEKFDVENYIVSKGPTYRKLERVFVVEGVSYKAVFSAESPRFVKKGMLLITEAGELFWNDAEQGLRRVRPGTSSASKQPLPP